MNGILSYPELQPRSFNPLGDVFCESLVEFLIELVLELLFSISPAHPNRPDLT
jgi:hypothetical protein